MNKEMDPFQNHCDKSIRNWLRSEFIVHASRLNAIECYCPPGIALRELRISYAPLTNGRKVENGHRKNSTGSIHISESSPFVLQFSAKNGFLRDRTIQRRDVTIELLIEFLSRLKFSSTRDSRAPTLATFHREF